VARFPLSWLPPRSKLDHPRMGNPGHLFNKSRDRGDVDVRCRRSASSDSESRRPPLDDAQNRSRKTKPIRSKMSFTPLPFAHMTLLSRSM
jgi:hypothetical protein